MTLHGESGPLTFLLVVASSVAVCVCLAVIIRNLVRRITKAVKRVISLSAATRDLAEDQRNVVSELRTQSVRIASDIQSRTETLITIASSVREQNDALLKAMGAIRPLSIDARLSNLINGTCFQNDLSVLRGDSSGRAQIGYSLERHVSQSRWFFDREIAPRSASTIVCSICIGSKFESLFGEFIESHQAYADAQGWDHYCVRARPPMLDRHPSWLKIPLIAYLFERGYERVLFLDADALVTDCRFDANAAFHDLASSGRCVMVTEDIFGINLGVMLWLKSERSKALLDIIWLNDSDVDNGTWEQHSLKTLMDMYSEVRAAVEIEPDQRRFNSFPEEGARWHTPRPDGTWKPGDFVCHFAGMRGGDAEACMQRYLGSRTAMGDGSSRSDFAAKGQRAGASR